MKNSLELLQTVPNQGRYNIKSLALTLYSVFTDHSVLWKGRVNITLFFITMKTAHSVNIMSVFKVFYYI